MGPLFWGFASPLLRGVLPPEVVGLVLSLKVFGGLGALLLPQDLELRLPYQKLKKVRKSHEKGVKLFRWIARCRNLKNISTKYSNFT